MIPNRSILLVTLPSLALILGFVWLRRRKSGDHCDTGGNNNKSRIKSASRAAIRAKEIEGESDQVDEITATNSIGAAVTPKKSKEPIEAGTDLKRSQSLPCANGISPKRDSIDRASGKSAPIDIAPNPRSPPNKLTEKQIDAELLKLKLEESDAKNLRSIQELEDDFEGDSPVDLPGSVERRRVSMMSPTKNAEPPVVIKANMTAKVSPKGSFAEAKYNHENGEDHVEDHDPTNENRQECDVNANKSNDAEFLTNGHHNGELEEEQNGNGVVGDDTQRDEPIASPPLSLCSLRSTDSGKGSSPPHSEGGALSSVYDFLVPVNVVHHLIGTKGRYVNQLKAKTGVNMIVKKHPASKALRICTMEGTQKEIDAALRMIRQKLPEKRYPGITLERVFFLPPHAVIPLPAMDTSCLQVCCVNNYNKPLHLTDCVSYFIFWCSYNSSRVSTTMLLSVL